MIKKIFPILALTIFSCNLGIGIVAPLLPLYVKNMGATGIWLGIIMASYSISNSFFVPIAGSLSDRHGRKLFLGAGLFAYGIISLGYIWADNVFLLSCVRFFQGIAGAVTLPIAMAYIGDLSPEGEEGKWMGYANSIFFSGFGFGPFMGGALTGHFGMNAAFITMSVLNLISFLITFIFLPNVKPIKIATSPSTLSSFKKMRRSDTIIGIFIFRLTEAVGRGGVSTFLPIIAAMIGISITSIGMLLTVSILSATVFSPIGGSIADKFSKRIIIVVGQLIFVATVIIIPFTHNFNQMLVVLLIQGFSGAICMPAAAAWTVEEGRKYGMASTMSVFFLAMNIGMIIGPIFGGVIADFGNIDFVFYIAGFMGIIGTAALIWFTRLPDKYLPPASTVSPR